MIGSWYVHFASLFYIIIYCYSLIYFIFRGDTYVVSSVFTCLMIIGESAGGVRILLEKGPSRHHIFEDQQFQRNIQKFIYCQKTKVARRRRREDHQGATPPGGAGPPLAAPPWGEATLAHSRHCPLVSSAAPASPPSSCHPAVTSWVESCQILRGNFPDVNYSCSWCYWVELLN
jgi:hypothetical protein